MQISTSEPRKFLRMNRRNFRETRRNFRRNFRETRKNFRRNFRRNFRELVGILGYCQNLTVDSVNKQTGKKLLAWEQNLTFITIFIAPPPPSLSDGEGLVILGLENKGWETGG